MGRPVDVTSLLPTFFSGKPLGQRLREAGVWRVWDHAVGERIAARARPVAFRDGVLTVAVSSAPWMQQLGFLKGQMIEAVNRALGEELVTDIYLKAGTVPPATRIAQPAVRHSRQLTPEEQSRIERTSSGIEDGELRGAFAGCYAAWLRTGLTREEA
jgi:hypothetical protein